MPNHDRFECQTLIDLDAILQHKSISSTEVYTKVFALDVAARHRVQFSMPEYDAVSMLKRIP